MPDLSELLHYRDLLYFFIWRDVHVRYRQTLLGIVWVIAQPITMMVIFSLFFGMYAKIPSEGIQYPVFVYAALLPWIFFSESVIRSTTSLVANAPVITKVYFPRILIPLSSILSPLADFTVSFILLVIIMAFFGIFFTTRIFLLPFFLLLLLVTAFGIGLWLSALNVQYRDFQVIVPFLVQIWLFASPVVYPSSIIPESLRTLYGINPLAGIIDGFRWVLLGTEISGMMIMVSTFIAILLGVSGYIYFTMTEQYFADVV